MKRTLFGLLLLIAFAISVNADVIFDSGTATFSATGTQFGRIFRDGNASVWGASKPFPGVSGAPTPRAYELFTVDTGIYPLIQISFDDPSALLFVAAYNGSFNPVNSGPNFGLDVNYLGDPGSSEPFGNPSFFQIAVTPGTILAIPINEVTPGTGANLPFELLVEGFCTPDFGGAVNGACPASSTVPEPTSMVLFGVGLSVVAQRVRKRLSA
jgi:hypothetical protein